MAASRRCSVIPDSKHPAELRGSLEELRALVPDQAPAPRADLAALLAAGAPAAPRLRRSPPTGTTVPAAVPPVSASLPAHRRERRGRKRRLAIVGGAVVGAMTLGAGAVAASSEDFRDSVNHTVGVIFQPAAPPGADARQPHAVGHPRGSGPVATARRRRDVPAESASRQPECRSPGGATPPAVGRGGVLPTPPQRPDARGPRLPGRGKPPVRCRRPRRFPAFRPRPTASLTVPTPQLASPRLGVVGQVRCRADYPEPANGPPRFDRGRRAGTPSSAAARYRHPPNARAALGGAD